jgi:hypothetical protein
MSELILRHPFLAMMTRIAKRPARQLAPTEVEKSVGSHERWDIYDIPAYQRRGIRLNVQGDPR